METLASPTRQCGIENMDADSGDGLAIEETGCPGNVPPKTIPSSVPGTCTYSASQSPVGIGEDTGCIAVC